MSSFADLRKARNARATQSYVPQKQSQDEATSYVSAQPEIETQKSLSEPEDLYLLPASVEVKDSTFGGRGLWSRSYYKPGKLDLYSSISNSHSLCHT
jgi:hypothetical protein